MSNSKREEAWILHTNVSSHVLESQVIVYSAQTNYFMRSRVSKTEVAPGTSMSPRKPYYR
jgi:hypothetical protein